MVRIGPEAGGGALMELKQEEDDDWDDDQAAPLPTLPQAEENHRAPWQRTGLPLFCHFPAACTLCSWLTHDSSSGVH